MDNNIVQLLCKEFSLKSFQVENVIEMLDEGSTVPFIARYRKEKTGDLSDVQLRDLSERLKYIRSLNDRKDTVIASIEEQGKLTEELRNKILKAEILTEVEDLYRPYKPKKRTRATIAIEKGLDPLATLIMDGKLDNVEEEAEKYINEDKKVLSAQDAIKGAQDIIAERISDNASFRKWIRELLTKEGIVQCKKNSKVEDTTPYEMYYDYNEAVKNIPSHRILAINRGEKEDIISCKITCDEEKVISYLEANVKTDNNICDKYIFEGVRDSLKRLIYPSVEREVRSELTDRGEEGAIKIFKENLNSLLMQPPIKSKVVLGYDPGFRTGCKIAVLDDTGKVLGTETVFAALPKDDKEKAIGILKSIVKKYNVDVISLGNGTACRESEELIAELIKEVKEETNKELYYVIVSEAGASVYSASELATKEYPDINVSLRGAISIGRRLQDPLAELVKIDPKSLGVGQYQHDVTQKKLEESLKGVVEDSVNNVGVDLNIATPSLLSYISGINSTIAKNIVEYREENGKFTSRTQLKKVKRLGDKAFEQCAGFLRVMEGKEPLDNTSVHPESYNGAKKLLDILGYTKEELKNGGLRDIEDRVKNHDLQKLSEEIGIGILTLRDIIKELKKPGRDPREELPKPIFKTGILELNQLQAGMELMGTVRNVADFGAFVDIGVHQDGLVHLSQLSNKFVKHPLDVVKVGDIVKVKVIEVDEKRGRISLTMKE